MAGFSQKAVIPTPTAIPQEIEWRKSERDARVALQALFGLF
jgi:hypothetical protein